MYLWNSFRKNIKLTESIKQVFCPNSDFANTAFNLQKIWMDGKCGENILWICVFIYMSVSVSVSVCLSPSFPASTSVTPLTKARPCHREGGPDSCNVLSYTGPGTSLSLWQGRPMYGTLKPVAQVSEKGPVLVRTSRHKVTGLIQSAFPTSTV